MTLGASFFFILFAVVQVMMYLAIRREWLPVTPAVGMGVALGIIFFMLMSTAQGNTMGQALVVGLLFGGLMSALTVGVAWYFHRGEITTYDEPVPAE